MHNKKIENFARETRKTLINAIKQKAFQYGINEKEIKKTTVNSDNEIEVNGIVIDSKVNNQRSQLINHIDPKNQKQSFNQLIEEVAYTWFNRITALRFLEVNDYLDHGIRVLSTTESGKKTPDIVENVLSMGLDIDKEVYYDLVDNASDNELYKYVLLTQCNYLSSKLDFLFESTNDYTELLLPDDLLDKGSFIKKLVKEIPEEDFKDVEIIGWLYQYYISELKDKNIKKKKYKKEDIPSVTQLFTPHWIVQYMVQNSLGKLWLESHVEERQQKLKETWEYYLEPAEQSEEVKAKLKEIINTDLKPEDITFLDPACGSGHILVYAFDILYEIYEKNGYNPRVIVENILEKNLYGLDIDKRATQLAKFALLMRARQKDRSILDKDIHLNIASIEESNQIEDRTIEYFTEGLTEIHKEQVRSLINKFEDAKEYGSLLKIDNFDYETINNHLEHLLSNEELTTFYLEHEVEIKEKIKPLLQQGRIIMKKYDVVTTNPPYGGGRKLPKNLKSFLKKNYSDYKKDIFAAFINKMYDYSKENGYLGLVTPFTWMFISSFEDLRKFIINNSYFDSLIQLEYNAFQPACIPVATFTLKKSKINHSGEFIKLSEFTGSKNQPIKTKEAVLNSDVDYRYTAKTEDFKKIPGGNIGYWVSKNWIENLDSKKLSDNYSFASGITTGNDKKFLRYWFEIPIHDSTLHEKNSKWVPICKGGKFRKWYGNYEYVINWGSNGEILKEYSKASVSNSRNYFKSGITWGRTTSSKVSVRLKSDYLLYNSESPLLIIDSDIEYILAYLNSNVTNYYLNVYNPTLHYQLSDMKGIPLLNFSDKNSIINKSKTNINISKKDWDSFETSWDFENHPLIEYKKDVNIVEEAFNNWSEFAKNQFNQLWKNEEELNRIFIEIYGLEDELTPDVKEKDVTVNKADYKRDIKSFISYAVGCMMGRYSLDEEGLAYAGGAFNLDKYESYIPDQDGIVTILDKDYFDNDVVKKFVEFVEVTFGEKNLEVNLDYIASALSPKSSEQPRDTIRRYFQTGSKFYTDHCRMYNKRPIYWKVSSGGRNPSFEALIYLHRYNENTLSTLRVNYVHPLQRKLKIEKEHLEQMIVEADSKSDESTYKARISDINTILHDLVEFDEKLGHLADQQISIDLDDGVKENYKIFEDILDKIR